MAQQNIGVGTVPNDGTGDTLRNAFIKTQNNFSEFYAAITPTLASNNMAVANTLTFLGAANVVTINSTAVIVGNTTNEVSINSTSVSVGNSTVNTFSNSTHFFSGNSTVFAYGNSTFEVLANASGQTVITPVSFSVGNSTANAFGNSVYESISNSTANIAWTPGSLTINSVAANLVVGNTTTFVVANNGGLTVSTNSFTLGTSNAAGHTVSLANGYIHLSSGMLMIWGTYTSANTIANVQVFSTLTGAAFTVNCFSVTATCNSVIADVAVTAVNSTSLTLISNSATATTVYWQAIGI